MRTYISFIVFVVLSIGLVSAQTSWTGAVDSKWNKSYNWTNGVPNQSTDAIIGDAYFTGSYQPELSGGGLKCNNLTIGDGAVSSSLTIKKNIFVYGDLTIGSNGTIIANKNNRTITLIGDWINNGTYSATSSTARVTFSGDSQTITGNSTFQKLRINSGTTLTLADNIVVDNEIRISGTFDPTASYTLSGTGDLILRDYANLLVKAANFSDNYTISGTIDLYENSYVNYASAAITQYISPDFSYGRLRISGGSTKELTANLPDLQSSSSSSGRIYIDEGTLDLKTFTADRGTSSTGGNIQIAAGAELKIGGTNGFPSNYNTSNLSSTSTVEYYGNDQTVLNLRYGNLILSATSGDVVKTMPSANIVVYGNFTTSLETGTSLLFTASGNITVFKDITLGANTTFDGGAYTHTFRGNWINNGTYTGSTSTCYFRGVASNLSGTGANNFYRLYFRASGITADGTTDINVNDNLNAGYGGTFTHASGGTVTMTGNNKSIGGYGLNFYNLVISDTITSGNSFVVNGDLTCNGSLTASYGNIVNMNGTGKSILGTGFKSFYRLYINGTITTATDFTVRKDLFVSTSGSFTATGGVASFTNVSNLSGTANLYDVTIDSGKTLKLGSNSVLGIANTLTENGTLNVTTYTPNTVKYNSSGNQDVIATDYDNLVLDNGGTKTSLGSFTVRNDLTINSGVEFDAGSATISIYQDWTNNGTFTASTSNISFVQDYISTITGATTFNDFTINKSSSEVYSYLRNSMIASNIIMTSGVLDTDTNSITTTGTRSGDGLIHGTITHNHAFADNTAYFFEGPQNSITFTSPSAELTSVTLEVTLDEVSDFDPDIECILREYEITIPSGTYTDADLRLHYESNELNAFEEPFLAIYKHNSGVVWDSIGFTSRDVDVNFVEHTSLSNIAGRFALSGTRRIVEWNGSTSTAWDNASNWTTIAGSDLSNRVPTSNDAVRLGTSTFTNQPTVNTVQEINALRFGDAQSVTLTLSDSLTILSSLKGKWSGNRSHSIEVGSDILDIGINLELSDGVDGNDITLNIGTGSIIIGHNLKQKATSVINFTDVGNLFISGDYVYTGGTVNAGASIITYSGSQTQIIAPITYNNLSFDKSSERAILNSATTVNGNVELSNNSIVVLNDSLDIEGDLIIGSSAQVIDHQSYIFLSGDWDNSGTFSPNKGTVYIDGTTAQTINASTFNELVINKASGTVTLTDSIDINNNLSINSGTLDLGVYSADRNSDGGSLTMASGTTLKVGGADNFPSGFATKTLDTNSTVEYNGSGTQNVLENTSYGNLVFSNGSSNTKSVEGNIQVNGNLSINSGATLALDSVNVTIYGNLTNSGTISPGESTFIVEGTSKTISGPLELNNLSVNGSYTISTGTTAFLGNLYIESTGYLNFGDNDGSIDGDLTNKGTLMSNGTSTFTGTRVQVIQLLNAISSSSTGVINFNGTVSPILNSTSSPSFATVNINNTAGVTASSPWFVFVACNIASDATFDGGAVNHTFYGDFTNNGTVLSSGRLYFSPGAPYSAGSTVKLGGVAFTSTGDVEFGGTAPITITDNAPVLNNVIISNTYSGGVSAPSSWNIDHELQILKEATFKAGTGKSHDIAGSLINNGTLDGETASITFSGSNSEINGGGVFDFYDLTIANGANLALHSNIGVKHDLINDGTFDGEARVVSFDGTVQSTISGATGTITIGDFVQNKTNTTTDLQIPVTVSSSLTLTDGIINTDATNILTLNDDVTASSGTTTSFVDGPLKKVGDDAFVFPTGDGTRWARLGISAPALTTDAFTAEYFDTNYVDTLTMAASPSPVLNNVSVNEYWVCERTNGSSNVTVQLFWESASASGITEYSSDLVVAHWNGSAWENAGQTAITNAFSGDVTSDTISSFSPFTLGSLTEGRNFLPVSLLDFSAVLENKEVILNWSTSTEINNHYFSVERSGDGVHFTSIDSVKGAGNSSSYKAYLSVDKHPLKGTSFYRLRQVDFDENYSYSPTKTILNYSTPLDVRIYPNPNNGKFIYLSIPEGFREHGLNVTIRNINGRIVYSKKIKTNQLEIILNVRLNKGVYFVEMGTQVQKLVVK